MHVNVINLIDVLFFIHQKCCMRDLDLKERTRLGDIRETAPETAGACSPDSMTAWTPGHDRIEKIYIKKRNEMNKRPKNRPSMVSRSLWVCMIFAGYVCAALHCLSFKSRGWHEKRPGFFNARQGYASPVVNFPCVCHRIVVFYRPIDL